MKSYSNLEMRHRLVAPLLALALVFSACGNSSSDTSNSTGSSAVSDSNNSSSSSGSDDPGSNDFANSDTSDSDTFDIASDNTDNDTSDSSSNSDSGSDDSSNAPEPVVISADVPNTSFTNVHTGHTVNLRDQIPGDKPVLLWFWAAH